MNKKEKEKEDLIAKQLNTPQGKKQFEQAFRQAFAVAADHFPTNSLGMHLARHYARLPFKVFKKEQT